ncbi:uncharacterized protein TRAVEDRAFT_72747 [Trametes versicolor FP-101664 SS1]|uniref:uncharacterized protein n=1 Tax=Trametes versicolor (strain FP-101664) TaxID=717944 RepID=UPI0004621BFD|nr:uncharacterized protein TRAVEDRAFT_72747 [Trametes versicolor FP-101664 SS1]EIW57747.1 hypothetical protein TRAVEDRAFT_72747 [Trametes versicolor FP-101664 SS1]
MSSQVTFVYQQGQAMSLIAIVLFAFISLLAIFGVLARYSWDPLVNLAKRRRQGASEHHSRAFFHTQLGAYIASLMLSNALSSISMIINVQWAADQRVTEGMLCNSQGILMQIGDAGGAYFTGAIAIHTFNTLVLRNKLPAWTCLAASIWGWLFAVLLAATPTWINNPVLGPIYGINGLSCGIAIRWSLLNMVLHLLPILLGSLVSVVMFTLVFLVLRGTITMQNGIKFNLNRQHRWSTSSITTIEYQRFIAAVARSMLWYPFAFNILLLPEIVVGLMESAGLGVPFEALVFASTLAALLGAANSLILCNTLRILRPFLEGNLTIPSRKSKDADMESFFAGVKSPRGFTSPSPTTPTNPEKAFIARDSKQEWTPPPRSASKPEHRMNVGESVSRNLSRVSRAISLKRKPMPSPPSLPSASLSRPITPVAELNAMITVPEPAYRKATLPSSPRDAPVQIGLPAPRRDTRSPVVRRPTLSLTADDEAMMTTINLNTPEPKSQVKSDNESDGTETRHTSANESLLSMYLSRTPEQEEMAKPPVPPKDRAAPKAKPQPMPLSARPSLNQSSLAPSPLATLRSARIPAPYAPSKEAFANAEWAERVAKAATSRRGATPATATTRMERRRSRSLDLDVASLAPRTPMGLAARTPTYGSTLAPTTPQRGPSLSAVSPARSPLSARRMPPSRAGSLTPTPAAYGGYL